MKIIRIDIPTSTGVQQRSLITGWCGRVFVHAVAYNHMLAIEKAFNQFMKPTP